MTRYAAIDIGTNSVLLLVAERRPDGRFEAVDEQAEITRLGRGVDQTKRLHPDAILDTVQAVASFAARAREQGAQAIVASATSAARDAENGAELLRLLRERAGVEVEIISGELEAKLSFAAVHADFATSAPGTLVCIDIGGGSTELIVGDAQTGAVQFRESLDVGSVRLTERFIRHDPPAPEELEQIVRTLDAQLTAVPPPPPRARVVGVAGTVTTLFAVLHRIDPYDATKVQGGRLTRAELEGLRGQLCAMTVAQRRQLPGLQPKRADVICAGALILERALHHLGASECTVSDRGLRWGLLAHKFATP